MKNLLPVSSSEASLKLEVEFSAVELEEGGFSAG